MAARNRAAVSFLAVFFVTHDRLREKGTTRTRLNLAISEYKTDVTVFPYKKNGFYIRKLMAPPLAEMKKGLQNS